MNKTSVNEPASKIELKKTEKALRLELKKTEKALRDEALRVEEKVENLDEKFTGKFDQVMTKLDGIAKVLDDLSTDNRVGTEQMRELRVEVDNHEKRISKLESPN